MQLCLSTFGCSDDVFDHKQPDQAIQVEKAKALNHSEIKIEYISTLNPNFYNAKIFWPEFDGEIKFKNSDQKYINDEVILTNNYTIENLEGGVEKSFFLEMQNNKRNQNMEIELKLLPPKDLILSGDFEINKNQVFTSNRIFIKAGSRIKSNQFSLTLNFSELIIEPNVIFSNFTLNQKEDFENIAKTGGMIIFNGGRIIGHLEIKLNSQAGGDAPAAYPLCVSSTDYWNRECFGKNGGDAGGRGHFLIDLNQEKRTLALDYEFVEVLGGKQGPHSSIRSDREKGDYCQNLKRSKRGDDPVYALKNCPSSSFDGKPATGGSICLKLNKDSDYECTEKK